MAALHSLFKTFERSKPFALSHEIHKARCLSLVAIVQACHDIRSGKCQIAVVAGSNCILDPQITRVFERMNLVSSVTQRQACEAFCDTADGYVRREAVVVVVLSSKVSVQAEGTRLCYAEVVGHNTVTGSGESVTTPSAKAQRALYTNVSAMATPLLPADSVVQYVECHGSGTKVGDSMEVSVLADVVASSQLPLFGGNKVQGPLHIGSVKSNVGHTESACGLVSLVKVVLSLENGRVPANLHYSQKRCNPLCKGLNDGTLRVVTEDLLIAHDALVAVNSFGFGGTHVQVLVKGMPEQQPPAEAGGKGSKVNPLCEPDEPWKNINPIFGRTEVAARAVSEAVKAHSFSSAISLPECGEQGTFRTRAFTTPNTKEVFTLDATTQHTLPVRDGPPPVWVVFAGNGGVWNGMAQQLYMRSSSFQSSFTRCAVHLKDEWSCDLLIQLAAWWREESHTQQESTSQSSSQGNATSHLESPIRNICDTTVALVAVQVCLIDVLKTVGFNRNTCQGFVGHSAGEIAAGYFDECYAWRTALDIAVLRGRMAAEVARTRPGAMRVVQGLSRKQVEETLEALGTAVVVGCHTGRDQVTLSGTEADLQAVDDALRREHVRITKIDTFHMAFHSKLIGDTDLNTLDTGLQKVFANAESYRPQRSDKWVSTCFEVADLSGANVNASYHRKGVKDCVEFARATEGIPPNAIIVEIGPRALFRSALKPRLSYSVLQHNRDAVDTLATVYGHLFLHGVSLSGAISAWHRPRELFPAPTHRALREAFLSWDHEEKFTKFLSLQPRQPQQGCAPQSNGQHFNLDLDGDAKWLRDHKVAGRCLFPAAAYLFIVWQGLVDKHGGKQPRDCIIEDFQVHHPVDTSRYSTLSLVLDVRGGVAAGSKANGVGTTPTSVLHAVVYHNDDAVASCSVRLQVGEPIHGSVGHEVHKANDFIHDTDAAYNQLGRHGYEYVKGFRSITRLSGDRALAEIRTSPAGTNMRSITQTLDSMLQLLVLNRLGHSQWGTCVVPVGIKSVCLAAQFPGEDVRVARVLRGHEVQISNYASMTGVEWATRLMPRSPSEVEVRELSCDILPSCLADSKAGSWGEEFVLIPSEVDIAQWKSQLARFNAVTEKAMHGARRTLIVSCARGFSGFVRSLQRERGFGHIRGLEVLSAVDSVCEQMDLKVIRDAQLYFDQNGSARSLLVETRQQQPPQFELLVEVAHEVEVPTTFPAKHGCFLALSPGGPETFNYWQPIGCSSRAQVLPAAHDTQTHCIVQVEFAGINFRDMMVGLRKLDRNKALTGYGRDTGGLGLEFAGLMVSHPQQSQLNEHQREKSKKVIGLGCDCITTTLPRQPTYLCWDLEDDFDLKKYATVPCAYSTVYYALCVRGNLHSGHKVLVHCGAGGVGQAALHICQSRLADPATQLFVTCGTETKREFIHAEFDIPLENIGDSRSCDFERMVMQRTSHKGVNLVLNSLTGDRMAASVSCLAFRGTLLELGKTSIDPHVVQSLRHNDRQFAMIDLDRVMACRAKFECVWTLLNDGLRTGEVKPLTHTVFPAPQATKAAFDFMSSADRIGKVVLKIERDRMYATHAPLATLVDAFTPIKQVVVIVGGFGGLGLCLSQLFAQRFRRACKIVLCTRKTEVVDTARQDHIGSLKSYGAAVEVFSGDLSQRAESNRLLSSIRTGCEATRLFGIFNTAAVTHDELFERMPQAAWEAPSVPKVGLTSTLCASLDDERFADVTANLQMFVCFSSVVAGEGNMGQTNYAFANSALEHFVRARVAAGKPALCVRLGLVKHVGLAASLDSSGDDFSHLRPLDAQDALQELEYLFASNRPGVYTLLGTDHVAPARVEPQGRTEEHVLNTILDVVRKNQQRAAQGEEELLNTSIDTLLDSLSTVYLLNALRAILGHGIELDSLSSRTPKEIAAHYCAPANHTKPRKQRASDGVKHPTAENTQKHGGDDDEITCHICTADDDHGDNQGRGDDCVVVIVTLGEAAFEGSPLQQKQVSRAALASLRSVQEQAYNPSAVLVVFEDVQLEGSLGTTPHNCQATSLVAQLRSVLPRASVVWNDRTTTGSAARFGALNSGIVRSRRETVSEKCWIAMFDHAHPWLPNHLERCMEAANAHPGGYCQIISAATNKSPPSQFVFDRSLEVTFAHASRETLVVRRDLLLEAGMFDEAFAVHSVGALADLDLYIRMRGVLSRTEAGEQRIALTGGRTIVSSVAHPTPELHPLTKDVELFIYKHHSRMQKYHVQELLQKFRFPEGALTLHRSLVSMPECEPVPLNTWSGERVHVRRDTSEVLSSAVESMPPRATPPSKMLVGLITSDPRRACNLVRDLGGLLDDHQHAVVIFVNSIEEVIGDQVHRMLQDHPFRSHVIRSTDRIVCELGLSQAGDGQNTTPSAQDKFNFPLPIAQARTVLQVFLGAVTDAESFDAVAVIDDDMRLPESWGVRDSDDDAGDILLSRAIKTPPNPTAMSMRTQLLDLVHALDGMYAPQGDVNVGSPDSRNAWHCPTFDVYHDNLQDQYYDLSSMRWNHLEVPRRFNCSHGITTCEEFVEQCHRRICVGDPLARESVSVEDGRSMQRGGCMVLLKRSFPLLMTPHTAPTVHLASGKHAASRRSDSFWVQRLHRKHGKVAVVRRHLAVLHDNTYDRVPTPERMREVVALEMVGAILCRPIDEREAFAERRLDALRCSTARIRGLCSTLRGRPYFAQVPGLTSVVQDLESRFCKSLWCRDVFNVVEEHLQRLKHWEPHKEMVPVTYCLDVEESKFLQNVTLSAQKRYPSAHDLRRDNPIMLPIPCIHRIHLDDGSDLCGAKKVQQGIGMSLPLSEVEGRLRELAKLHRECTGTERQQQSTTKALVTMDDGFRDVLLLCPVFKELSHSLQPVVFIPSELLKQEDGEEESRDGVEMHCRRHLPLTCLYEHCSAEGIDPNDKSRLGNATRSELKSMSEKQQYEVLQAAGIATNCSTSDLLNAADLHSLSEHGWWVASHGPDHSNLTKSAAFGEVVNQLEKDMELLAKRNWTPWFAWPEGLWCSRIVDALHVAVKGHRPTAQFGLSIPPNGEPQHPAVLPRVAWVGGKRKRRVLVTGGKGFLGQHLCLLLRAYGFDVFTYDIADGQDILDRAGLKAELRDNNITACVHLAAVSDLNEAERDPRLAKQVNIEGTDAVLSCCDAVGVRVLYASTCCVYGNNDVVGVNNEIASLAPTEVYAETKVAGEQLVLKSPRVHELQHVVMRLATFYGPGMRDALATAKFLEAALCGSAIHIHGSGEQTRCFTHVHDVAEGIRVILQSDFAGVVNVSDNRECSVNELAEIVMKVADSEVEVQYVQDRTGQITRSRVCNARLRALGNRGWSPTFTLEAGMRQCAELSKLKRASKVKVAIATSSNALPIASMTAVASAPDRPALFGPTKLPISLGLSGNAWVSEELPDQTQVVAYAVGDLTRVSTLAVRIHSECLFGDVLGSLKCDCGPQKDDFLAFIGDSCPGVLLYMKGHEGRGAGLATKTRAYADVDIHPEKHHNHALLDAGATTLDSRTYDVAADVLLQVLAQQRVGSNLPKLSRSGADRISDSRDQTSTEVTLVLHTNNGTKLEGLSRAITRLKCPGTNFRLTQHALPATAHRNRFNEKYLREKELDNGHAGLSTTATTCPAVDVPSPMPCSLDSLPGTTIRVNNHVFEAVDHAGLTEFIREHGFAVVRGVVSPREIESAKDELERILQGQYTDVCEVMGDQISYDTFGKGVSQVRDLFLKVEGEGSEESNIFRHITTNPGSHSLASLAQRAMNAVDSGGKWHGIKLLHDHIIKKPPGKSSKKIPLHQDSMFWPVDIPGCSTWTILTEATLDGGCMEILNLASKPHLHRQNTAPVDFMADELANGLRMVLEEDSQPVRYLVPMRAGDTLVFTSNTWHRSSPNGRQDLTRTAYIQTWIHPQARWRPDLVPWHPVNEHLQREGFQANDVLSGSRHPTVALGTGCGGERVTEREEAQKSVYVRQSRQFAHSARKGIGQSISMFDASDIVLAQMRNILSLHLGVAREDVVTETLVNILKDPSTRDSLVECTMSTVVDDSSVSDDGCVDYLEEESGCESLAGRLSWVLQQIMLSAAAYTCHRSRNVFNSAYGAWWALAGEAWNKRFLDGPFRSDYMLSKSDVSSFLACIRVDQKCYDMKMERGQLELLSAVIAGCFEYIPFQNFAMLTRVQETSLGGGSVSQRSPPSLGEIISDMVAGIGGLCSTRNPFLLLLLKALGFGEVCFVSGTMCSEALGEMRDNMHIALMVTVEAKRYWVDIGNGFPYLKPVPLDATDDSFVIEHPYVDTKLERTQMSGVECDVVVVKHRRRVWGAHEWVKNYYFVPSPVEFTVFDEMLSKHYDHTKKTGPFLTNLRFNVWTAHGGALLRNEEAHSVRGGAPDADTLSIDLWSSEAVAKFKTWCRSCDVEVSEELIVLLPEAWKQSQACKGTIKPAEVVTVTGGFFDNTANAYVGRVTVWRDSTGNDKVKALTFHTVKEYAPKQLPVVNKGFAGGSWYNGKLYVCWPNSVAVVDPTSDFAITQYLDNPGFNDLHHVHACKDGIWVANTGMDSVDHLTLDGRLLSRIHCVDRATKYDGVTADVRDQAAHTARRGKDKVHVNHVAVSEECAGEVGAGGAEGLPPTERRRKTRVVTATLLQTKQVVQIQEGVDQPHKVAARLKVSSPPHEGFVQQVDHFGKTRLMWNSTVDGLVVATDADTGDTVKTWDLSECPGIPRGWTRGLCVLDDGFLVGSTIIRGSAERWLQRHNNVWNFDTKDSSTAVVFVPFHTPGCASTVCAVDVLTHRAAKVFSLLREYRIP